MDDTRAARAAEMEPGQNFQFDRGWTDQVVTGPDTPAAPAHGTAWRSGEAGDPNTSGRHRSRAWRAAEAAFRAVGGSRATGLHQRGDR